MRLVLTFEVDPLADEYPEALAPYINASKVLDRDIEELPETGLVGAYYAEAK